MKAFITLRSLFFLLVLFSVSSSLQAQSISVSFTTSQYMGGYNVSCRYSHDGYIKITNITGGTPPYTYVWNTGQTTDSIGGKYAGIYTLFVTDSTNTTTAAYARLFAPNALTVALSSTDHHGYDISINGGDDGNINSTVNGGTGSYYWSWSNSSSTQNIDNLTAGTYAVTVTDDNGCSFSAYKTLIEPDTLDIAGITKSHYGAYNVKCAGESNGTISITMTGGAIPYTYEWSIWATTQSISGLSAGTYHVTVTDANGAETGTNVTLTSPGALEELSSFADIPSCHCCNDGKIGFFGAGGGIAPYQYSWKEYNSSYTTVLHSGVVARGASDTLKFYNLTGAHYYACFYKDSNGCAVDSITASEVPGAADELNIDFTVTNVLCHGASTGQVVSVVTGGSCPPYSYSWSTGATTANISGLAAGSYTLRVIDAGNDTIFANTEVHEPNPLSLILEANMLCNDTIYCVNISTYGGHDGEVNATASGGTDSYYYSWSNGSSSQNLINAGAGKQKLIVTDENGCTVSDSVVLTQPRPFHVTTDLGLHGTYNLSCPDGFDGIFSITIAGGFPEYDLDIHGYAEDHLELLGAYYENSDSLYFSIGGFHAGELHLTIKDAYNEIALDSTFIFTAPDTIEPNFRKSIFPNTYNVGCYNCSNGRIYAEPVGGTPPYSIEWYQYEDSIGTGDTLKNLHAGDSYFYILTDANGCSAQSEMITLTRPDYEEPFHVTVTPHIYIGGYHVSCNGASDGKIRAVVTGGTSPYTYSWSNGATTRNVSGLALGTYSLTVTDSAGAHTVISETVELVNQPDLMYSWIDHLRWPYDLLVQGGSDARLQASANGGQPPYQYSWSTGATTVNLSGLSAGTYSLIATDKNGCTNVYPDSVIEPSATSPMSIASLTYDNYNGYNIACGKDWGRFHFAMSGGTPPYDLKLTGTRQDVLIWWNNDAKVSYPWDDCCHWATDHDVYCWGNDSIQVKITDYYGAEVDTVVYLRTPPPLDIIVTQNNSSFGYNNGRIDVNVTGGLEPIHYNWSVTNTTHPTYLESLAPGLYSVAVSDSNGCGGTFDRWIMQGGGAWGIDGNNITDTGHYLGTASQSDLVIKTDGEERMRINHYGSVNFRNLKPDSGYAVLLVDSTGDFGGIKHNNMFGLISGPGMLRIGFYPSPNIYQPQPSPGTGKTVWPFRQSQFNDSNMFTKWNKLGLGTDNPQERLEVAGKGRFTDEDSAGKFTEVGFSVGDSSGYISSTAALSIKTNGQEAMRLEADGSVKIKSLGSSSSTSPVWVDSDGKLRSNGNNVNTSPCAVPRPWLQGVNPLTDVVLCGSENVGIGTMQPEAQLDIYDLSYNPDRVHRFSVGSASGAGLDNGTTYLGFNAARTSSGWKVSSDGSNNGGGVMWTQVGGEMNFASIGKSSSPTSSQTLNDGDIKNRINMQINPDRNIRINNGMQKLVLGKIDPSAGNEWGYSYIGFNAYRVPDPSTPYWFLESDGANNGAAGIQTNAGGDMRFFTFPSTAVDGTGGSAQWPNDPGVINHTKLIIRGDGKVGIGTSHNAYFASGDPYKLYVTGGIRTEKIRVDLSDNAHGGWGDFVFDKSYELKSLKELEKFIETNHHLPGIPSACEVKEDGIDLADMQNKLLQKIEELTLYTISLQKQIEQLKKEK